MTWVALTGRSRLLAAVVLGVAMLLAVGCRSTIVRKPQNGHGSNASVPRAARSRVDFTTPRAVFETFVRGVKSSNVELIRLCFEGAADLDPNRFEQDLPRLQRVFRDAEFLRYKERDTPDRIYFWFRTTVRDEDRGRMRRKPDGTWRIVKL